MRNSPPFLQTLPEPFSNHPRNVKQLVVADVVCVYVCVCVCLCVSVAMVSIEHYENLLFLSGLMRTNTHAGRT